MSASPVPLIRPLLVIGGVAVLGAGFAEWTVPLHYNPMLPRVLFAVAAVFLAILPSLKPSLNAWMRELAWAWTYLVCAWFLYVAFRHQLMVDDVLGLLPTTLISAVLGRTRLQGGLLFLLFAVGLGLIGLFGEPLFSLVIAAILLLLAPLVLSALTVFNEQLRQELVEATSTLEHRVATRTSELIDEIAVRQAAEERAEASSRAKSSFLATMSHELRTPLNAVLGYSEMIEEELEVSASAETLADLRHVQRAATHLLGLIDQMLDLSRIEAGAFEVELQEVELREVARSVLELLEQAQVPISLRIPAGLMVWADPRCLQQVLLNLCSNAQKFTEAGSIDVHAIQDAGRAGVAVHDTGVGVPAADHSRIFDRFVQVDGTSTRVHGGVGLGLAISRELVERMHGSIEIESEVGVGSVFRVWLPRPQSQRIV